MSLEAGHHTPLLERAVLNFIQFVIPSFDSQSVL